MDESITKTFEPIVAEEEEVYCRTKLQLFLSYSVKLLSLAISVPAMLMVLIIMSFYIKDVELMKLLGTGLMGNLAPKQSFLRNQKVEKRK